MIDRDAISAVIREATQRPFTLAKATPVGGGSINASYCLDGTDGTRYFLKLNDARHHPMFAAEAEGLNAIAATGTIRVPQPIAHGSAGEQSYLILEHLELNSHGDARLLGVQLAALHRCTSLPLPFRERAGVRVDTLTSRISTPIPPFPLMKQLASRLSWQTTPAKSLVMQGGRSGDTLSYYGYAQDNFIGTTAQHNTWGDDWVTFWREQRLGFQLRLAEENGYGGRLQLLGQKLLDALPVFFADYTPQPSLLHGDLWSGNHAFLGDGTPAIFDPAVYYGDREADLAMTELFGGYSAEFYAAYRAAYPLDAGYAMRRDLYNLYHTLNHANLFGGGYLHQAEQMMQKLLEAAGI